MTDKPSRNEDEFFAREDAEKLYRAHAEQQKAQTEAERDAEKAAHWLHCGKCGYKMDTIRWRDVEIEKCFRCGAVLLDDGELEKLAGQENEAGALRSFVALFKRG
jgi:ribosomal protein S27AE